jgi:hypothetical protein
MTNGNIVRGLLAELRSRGLFEVVREGVSPQAQAMMDSPPLHIAWAPSHPYEELWDRLGGLFGREKVQEIAYACTLNAIGPLITPLIRTYIKLSGASLATTLGHMGSAVAVQYRGVQLDYQPDTDHSTYLTMRFPDPVSDFIYASWEGAFRYGKELVGSPAFTIGRFEIFEGGKAGRVYIHW